MKCIISKSSNFKKIFKLFKFSIFCGVTNKKNKKFDRENLIFWINKNSGTVRSS